MYDDETMYNKHVRVIRDKSEKMFNGNSYTKHQTRACVYKLNSFELREVFGRAVRGGAEFLYLYVKTRPLFRVAICINDHGGGDSRGCRACS